MSMELQPVVGRVLLSAVDEIPDAEPGSLALPAGTVSFLLTDVENSTLLWQRHPAAMGSVIARHYEILDEAITRFEGVRPTEQGEGDSVVGAFSRASDALAAAVEAQRLLQREPWTDSIDLRVRMAVHTGEAVQRDARNYVGTTIIRTARIRSAGHGGQILVSEAAAAVAVAGLPPGAVLVDTGSHRLKDLARPERIWLLTHPALLEVNTPLRSLDAFRHNLPSMATPMIGRRRELVAVLEEMERERLVTLTGSGGVGKTRLAAQIGAEVVDRFAGGVWWLELAPVSDGAAVAATLLAAMGASEDGLRPPLSVAVDRLASQGPALVVFDNCEHVLDATAQLVDALRQAVPDLVILATSREPLGVPGEITWRVPSLALPPRDERVGIDALSQFDSVRLFLERARRARPQLTLDDSQAAAVAEICHRLDGIPLAIELAAARCRQLSPERIAAELADRFRLLTGGARTLLPRQQTLLASVAWSHDLLDDDERRVLRRLGVFAGPFQWEAAEAVVAAPGDMDRWTVLDVVGRLVDKSLVQLEDHGDYRLLETVRQFAVERARDAGELAPLRDAHADWWIAEMERLDARHPSVQSMAVCDRFAPDLHQALAWVEDDLARRYRLLGLVALCWSWAGRTDDLLGYVRRWLLDGPPAGHELAWAIAFAQSGSACNAYGMFELAGLAYQHVVDARDGRAAIALALLLVTAPLPIAVERVNIACELAEADGVDRVLSAYGPFALTVVAPYDLAAVSRSIDIVRAARRRDPGPNSSYGSWWFEDSDVWGDHLGLVEVPDFSRGELFMIDRLHAAAGSACFAVYSGDADRLDRDVELITPFETLPMPAMQAYAGCVRGFRQVLRGEKLTRAEIFGLSFGYSKAAATYDLPACRALFAAGEFKAARRVLDRLAQPGSGTVAHPLASAVAAMHNNDVREAERWLYEALTARASYPWDDPTVDILELLAVVSSHHGDHQRAARLIGAAATFRGKCGHVHRLADQQTWIDIVEAEGTATLGLDGWAEEQQRGRGLSDQEALSYASRPRSDRKRASAGWDSLTPTERQVAELVAQGLTNPQIAERLIMGRATVKTHVTHILAKTSTTSRAEFAAALARRKL